MEGLRDILDCGRIVDQFGVKRFPKFDPISGHTLDLDTDEHETIAVPIHPIFLIHFMPQGKNIIMDWFEDSGAGLRTHSWKTPIKFIKALESGELFFKRLPLDLLCRRLESGRIICIDTNFREIYVGGVGIAHIDMNNSNNKLDNLRMVCFPEAIHMLMNFDDDGGSSNKYLRAEPEWYKKVAPRFGIGPDDPATTHQDPLCDMDSDSLRDTDPLADGTWISKDFYWPHPAY